MISVHYDLEDYEEDQATLKELGRLRVWWATADRNTD